MARDKRTKDEILRAETRAYGDIRLLQLAVRELSKPPADQHPMVDQVFEDYGDVVRVRAWDLSSLSGGFVVVSYVRGNARGCVLGASDWVRAIRETERLVPNTADGWHTAANAVADRILHHWPGTDLS